MAKFEARDNWVYQLPTGNTFGFKVCECEVARNAEEVARCLNQDDELKELATWLLKQKTLHLNKERTALLKGIVGS